MDDLHSAAAQGKSELVSNLLDQGVDVNGVKHFPCPTPNFDVTPVMMAAESGHHETVSLLLERGANPNMQDIGGWTALMKAAARGHTEVVRLLLAFGADADQKNNAGHTALEWASSRNAPEVVKMLRCRVPRYLGLASQSDWDSQVAESEGV